ncbi:sigma-70 family RNA polymerase sigma factor [Patescibacteria group bacterium]|nr:sigma-70 family RNA polymerase sigma factor [Patescibacteria group bacterium]
MSKEALRRNEPPPERDKRLPDSTTSYLNEISQFPLLSPQQEIAYAQAIERGREAFGRLQNFQDKNGFDSPEKNRLQQEIVQGREARSRFIEGNLRLVVAVAKKYLHLGLPLLDLIQEGNIGLVRAVEKYDWRKGSKFSTYGALWIRQAVMQALHDKARAVRLPVDEAQKMNKIRASYHGFLRETGREPSSSEIAEQTRVPVEKVERYMEASFQKPISLEGVVLGEEEDSNLADFIIDPASPVEQQVINRIRDEGFRKALKSILAPKQYRILELYFGLGGIRSRPFETIGREMGISRQRANKIVAEILEKLREFGSSVHLRDYLD